MADTRDLHRRATVAATAPEPVTEEERERLARTLDGLMDERTGVELLNEERVNLIRAAALLRSLPKGRGWQPIKTAPKDGTVILVWVEWPGARGILEGGVELAQWLPSGWSDLYRCDPFDFQPTHWMPLPAPPVPATPGNQGAEK